MADKIYPKGIVTFKKHDKAPDFVLGTMIITIDELNIWIEANKQYLTDYKGKDQLKLQIQKGQEGRISLQVDTYGLKPKDEPEWP